MIGFPRTKYEHAIKVLQDEIADCKKRISVNASDIMHECTYTGLLNAHTIESCERAIEVLESIDEKINRSTTNQ